MVELTRTDYDALVEEMVEGILAAAAPRAPRQAPARPVPGLAAALEPTLLAADAQAGQIEHLCAQAAGWGTAAVCVTPAWVALAAERLRATPVAVAAVVGFPLGACTGPVKIYEAAECLKLGADELDVVMDLGALRSGADARAGSELRSITDMAHAAGARVKVIVEMSLLDAGELERACALALDAGADFLKNGSGFAGGATVEGIARLRELVGDRSRIKAAGGIRTSEQARALLASGADRIGTSSAAAILEG